MLTTDKKLLLEEMKPIEEAKDLLDISTIKTTISAPVKSKSQTNTTSSIWSEFDSKLYEFQKVNKKILALYDGCKTQTVIPKNTVEEFTKLDNESHNLLENVSQLKHNGSQQILAQVRHLENVRKNTKMLCSRMASVQATLLEIYERVNELYDISSQPQVQEEFVREVNRRKLYITELESVKKSIEILYKTRIDQEERRREESSPPGLFLGLPYADQLLNGTMPTPTVNLQYDEELPELSVHFPNVLSEDEFSLVMPNNNNKLDTKDLQTVERGVADLRHLHYQISKKMPPDVGLRYLYALQRERDVLKQQNEVDEKERKTKEANLKLRERIREQDKNNRELLQKLEPACVDNADLRTEKRVTS